MTADVDLVAAYEAGAEACHAPPVRDCCARAGVRAVEREVLLRAYRTIRRHAATYRDTDLYRRHEQEHREKRTDATRRAVLVDTWYARGIEEAARDVAQLLGVPEWEIDDEPNPGADTGWGAMLRHGTPEPRYDLLADGHYEDGP